MYTDEEFEEKIILVSNDSTECYPSNSLSNFRNNLPSAITTKHLASCKIALEALSFENSFIYEQFPKKISVVINELTQDRGSILYSKALAVIPFSKPDTAAFYHDVGQKEWMKIGLLNLSSLSVSLLDENNKRLNLGFGQPSFLRIHLSTMMADRFTVRLSSREVSSVGINSDFRAMLQQPLPLSGNGNKWKVALSSVHFPRSYERFSGAAEGAFQMFVVCETAASNVRQTYIQFSKAEFVSVERLVFAINFKLNEATEKTCDVDLIDGKIRFTFGDRRVLIIFSHNFACITGFTEFTHATYYHGLDIVKLDVAFQNNPWLYQSYTTDPLSEYPAFLGEPNTFHLCPKLVNVDRFNPNTMLLYCDIIDPVIIGSKYCKILKLIPVPSNREAKTCFYESQHLDFVSLSATDIPCIQLQLRRFDGELIKFHNPNKEVLYTLVFRCYDC